MGASALPDLGRYVFFISMGGMPTTLLFAPPPLPLQIFRHSYGPSVRLMLRAARECERKTSNNKSHSFFKQCLHDLQFMEKMYCSPNLYKLTRADISCQFYANKVLAQTLFIRKMDFRSTTVSNSTRGCSLHIGVNLAFLKLQYEF